MSLRTFERQLSIERETRKLKRLRLADLAAGADGSCTEPMTGLASESTVTLSVTTDGVQRSIAKMALNRNLT